jgi:hypothetical protein
MASTYTHTYIYCRIKFAAKCKLQGRDVRWKGAVENLYGIKQNEKVVKCYWVKFKWVGVKRWKVKSSEVE